MNPEFDLQTDGPVKSSLDWSFESKIEHLEKSKNHIRNVLLD